MTLAHDRAAWRKLAQERSAMRAEYRAKPAWRVRRWSNQTQLEDDTQLLVPLCPSGACTRMMLASSGVVTTGSRNPACQCVVPPCALSPALQGLFEYRSSGGQVMSLDQSNAYVNL